MNGHFHGIGSLSIYRRVLETSSREKSEYFRSSNEQLANTFLQIFMESISKLIAHSFPNCGSRPPGEKGADIRGVARKYIILFAQIFRCYLETFELFCTSNWDIQILLNWEKSLLFFRIEITIFHPDCSLKLNNLITVHSLELNSKIIKLLL